MFYNKHMLVFVIVGFLYALNKGHQLLKIVATAHLKKNIISLASSFVFIVNFLNDFFFKFFFQQISIKNIFFWFSFYFLLFNRCEHVLNFIFQFLFDILLSFCFFSYGFSFYFNTSSFFGILSILHFYLLVCGLFNFCCCCCCFF